MIPEHQNREVLDSELQNKIRAQLYNSQSRQSTRDLLKPAASRNLYDTTNPIFNSTQHLPLGNFEKEEFFVQRIQNTKQLKDESSIDKIFKKLEHKKDPYDRNEPKNYINGLQASVKK